ncbi:MAG: FecR family protein [Cyanobacteria bacterium J06642_2]
MFWLTQTSSRLSRSARVSLWAALALGGAIAGSSVLAAPDEVTLPSSRATRWLEVRRVEGEVTHQGRDLEVSPAILGERLTQTGERLTTGAQSSALLAFDDGIGFARVTEETEMAVTQMDVSAGQGKITRLSVPRGNVTLQIRRFTNPNSRLEVETPAGIAGVRGTVFGIGVSPTGKMAVATQEGAVAAIAQEQTVLVEDGFYSLVVPGQPPTPPRELTGSLELEVEQLGTVEPDSTEAGGRIVGRVDPVNAVYLNGEAIEIGLDGNFDNVFPIRDDFRLDVVVRSPLGGEERYELCCLIPKGE